MFALYMFGKVLEMVWEASDFDILFVTGLGAMLMHMLVTWIDIEALKPLLQFLIILRPNYLAKL